MDELTYTSDKLNFYINEIIEKSTHHKTLEKIEEKGNGFVIKTIEALKPNKDIGITHKEFINTYVRYKELTGKKLDSIIIEQYKDPSAYVVTSIEEKEYFYTIECLNEIEKEIIDNEPNVVVHSLKKNKFELNGHYIRGTRGNIFFQIYNRLKELDKNFKRSIHKDALNWILVTSKTKVELNNKDIEKINNKKKIKEDRKNNIVSYGQVRYKVREGVNIGEVEFFIEMYNNIDRMSDGYGGGYWTDGIRIYIGNTIGYFDEKDGGGQVLADLIK